MRAPPHPKFYSICDDFRQHQYPCARQARNSTLLRFYASTFELLNSSTFHSLLPQLPPTLSILDHFRPIPPPHPIQIPHRRPLPQPPHLRYRLHRIADPPKRPQNRPLASPQTLHLAPRNFIAISIVPLHIARAQRPLMQPVSPNQRIHRVQPRVPEKSHPQREISLRTIIRIQISARFLPQTPPPKCRLLLNMLVRPCQKSPPRPSRHRQHINRHPRRADLRRPPRDPLHIP